MYKVKRTIYLGKDSMDVWLGLEEKKGHNGTLTVYLFTDDPDNPLNHAEPILSGIRTKEEALRQGIDYAKKLLHSLIKQQSTDEKTEDPSKI